MASFSGGVRFGECTKCLTDVRSGGSSGCVEVGAFGREAYILTGYFDRPKVLKLTLLIRAYFRLDGHHIQFNVVDAETLHQAQANPEQY